MLEEPDVLNDLDQLQSRYHVLRHLGHDGGCAVYAVRARSSGRHFLVKVMPKPDSGSAQAGTLHVWQAHTMARLDHPRLIVLHTVNHLQGGAVALAMERRRGETLAERIERAGPLPLAEVESTLRDVAEALAYLHRRGVVHRGVSLDSILLDRDSACSRLAHFGIPRGARGRDVSAGDAGPSHRTHAHEPLEQGGERAPAGPSDPSPQSDLYSLGLVACAILTGRESWAGDPAAVRVPDPLPPLETLRADAPPHLCRAIEGCLQRDPRGRWRDAEEFLLRLDPSADAAPSAARPELSWLRVDWGRPLGAVGTVLTGPLDAVRRRRVALALPAALLTTVAWAMLGADDVPAPPAPEPQRVTSVGVIAGESTRFSPAERPSVAGVTLPAIGAELATVEPHGAPSRPSALDRQPAAEPSTSPPPAPAQRPPPSLRGAGSGSGASDAPLPEASARRRSPVPLLGVELPPTDRGR